MQHIYKVEIVARIVNKKYLLNSPYFQTSPFANITSIISFFVLAFSSSESGLLVDLDKDLDITKTKQKIQFTKVRNAL